MKFDDLDTMMRVFETAHDHCVLPGLYMVARLDGRDFTRLTKERHAFERPFDLRFRDLMIATTEHLMACGFRMHVRICGERRNLPTLSSGRDHLWPQTAKTDLDSRRRGQREILLAARRRGGI
ncbi:MAG TPA: tRNA(His) guanylyltransferase Thg1 family protein [Ardenticatenaceae bacterium]|nr:tRNA(His) guanylyltransferase Thg1 family protein [Ardenticatenaceae bacterium]